MWNGLSPAAGGLPPLNFIANPPLALYVHIPWCVRKCPYCDFNSHERKDTLPERAYIKTVLEDLDGELPRVWGRNLESVFIGGGTPSLFSAQSIDDLLIGIRSRLRCKPDMEITLEANPGTAEAGRFADYAAAGVNRLSIGAQSFDNDRLAALGRIHDGRQAAAAAEMAHKAGLGNFNLDLMFGLPGQRVDGALRDIRRAMDLEPAHISHYELTLEPNTLFHAQPPGLPEDEMVGRMLETCLEALSAGGYGRYEVSAYAREGRRCRHNLNYWRFGDYLGIGAGAHGKLTLPARRRIERNHKRKHPQAYLDGPKRESGRTALTQQDAALEFMMNALRLVEGVPSELFTMRTGLPLDFIRPTLQWARSEGLMVEDATRLATTQRGYAHLNTLLAHFSDS